MRLLVLVLAVLVLLAGCATGKDAVSQGGGEFTFVAPGGQTSIFYDPPAARGTLRGLGGESLTAPGRTVGVDDFPGQVVVLNIWGSWCGPCRSEADDLERVYAATRPSGVAFLGIDVRDEIRSAATDFVHDRGITYPSVYDPPGRSLLALHDYPRNTVPSTIVLDRAHRVAAVFLVQLLDSDLMPVVARVAAEPAAAAGRSRGQGN